MSLSRTPAELSEQDFAAIGRVIVHAAALENMLVMLASALLWHVRSDEGKALDEIRAEIRDGIVGEFVGKVIDACRSHDAPLTTVATPEYLGDLWRDCSDLFMRRNAVAHSFWEKTPEGTIEARRALPRRLRSEGFDLLTVGGTLDGMDALTEQLADAIRDTIFLLNERWPNEWPEAQRRT
jgi:hypothetical protein